MAQGIWHLRYQTSGKKNADGERPHRYCNCRKFLKSGKGACPGCRVPEAVIDQAVLEHLAGKVFTREKWKSKRRRAAPPRIAKSTIELVQRMARENRLWGAERIRGELLKLDIRVSKRIETASSAPTSIAWPSVPALASSSAPYAGRW